MKKISAKQIKAEKVEPKSIQLIKTAKYIKPTTIKTNNI